MATSSAGADGGDGLGAIGDGGAIDLWQLAGSLSNEDLGHLAVREGSAGLVAGATNPDRRKVAVYALRFVDDLDALPFLGEVAAGADAPIALAAADSATEIAAGRRGALDAEDALEVRDGCDRFAAVAKDPGKPKPLRLRAVRVLRLLEDRGCAREVPDVP